MRRVVAGVVIGAVSAALVALGGGTAHAADGTAVQQLADAYAPIVVIRTQSTPCGAGEPYLPVSVDSVLGQPSVTLMGPGGQSLAAPTSADLAGKGDGWYLDLPGKPLNPGCDYEQWFAQTWGGKPAVLYARAATDPDHPGMLALQYWFWWVFNDWNDKHEGDWEMIQLLFPVGTVEQALTSTPESIAFAQHEGSETAPWADTKVHRQGNHIVVYPAAGSHAAYYTQAQWFGKSAAAGFGCDNTLAPGTILHPQIQVMPDQPTPGFEWLSFTGRWGEKAPSFNNGPTGPNTKTQWAHPVTWQEEEGRPEAAPLPIIGGPAVSGFCQLTESGSLLFIKFLDSPWLVGVLVLAALALIGVAVARTDWLNNDDPELDRERRAGQIAVAALDTLRKRPGAYWISSLIIAVASLLTLLLADWLVQARPGENIADVDGFASNVGGVGMALLAAFILLPVVAMGMATAVEITDAIATHREIDAVTAFRRVLVHPGGWFVAIAVYILVSLLAATWWLLPVALFLVAVWAVVLPATELEDQGVVAGMRSSARLTRGQRFRAMLVGGLLIWLAFSLPSGVGAILLLVTGWSFAATNVVSVVIAAILVPAAAVGLTLLYYDLRRKAARADATA